LKTTGDGRGWTAKVRAVSAACSPWSLRSCSGRTRVRSQGCCGSESLAFSAPSMTLTRLRAGLRGLPTAPRSIRAGSMIARHAQLQLPPPRLTPRWWRTTVSRGIRPLHAPPPFSICRSTPGRCRHLPSVERSQTPDLVPPSRFLTALTACSSADVAGLLHPAAGHGVRCRRSRTVRSVTRAALPWMSSSQKLWIPPARCSTTTTGVAGSADVLQAEPGEGSTRGPPRRPLAMLPARAGRPQRLRPEGHIRAGLPRPCSTGRCTHSATRGTLAGDPKAACPCSPRRAARPGASVGVRSRSS
jgi:hypothetical protein